MSRIRNSCLIVLVMECEAHVTTHHVFRDTGTYLMILPGLSNLDFKNLSKLPRLKLSILPKRNVLSRIHCGSEMRISKQEFDRVLKVVHLFHTKKLAVPFSFNQCLFLIFCRYGRTALLRTRRKRVRCIRGPLYPMLIKPRFPW